MKPALLASLLCSGLAALVAFPAEASIACSNTDISPNAISCAGFYPGNLVNSGPNEPQMAAALALLGFTYAGDSNGIEQFDANSGTIVDFNTLLVGQTIIGVHYGNGQGSPGRPVGSVGNGDGDDTAFYLFDAGAGLDTFTLAFNAASTVTLFQTGGPQVPEPSTWAMMLIGFFGMGYAMRRRRKGYNPQVA